MTIKINQGYDGVVYSQFVIPGNKYAVGVCRQSLKELLEDYDKLKAKTDIMDAAIARAAEIQESGGDPSDVLSEAITDYAQK